jgi:hypothetical protein
MTDSPLELNPDEIHLVEMYRLFRVLANEMDDDTLRISMPPAPTLPHTVTGDKTGTAKHCRNLYHLSNWVKKALREMENTDE